MAPICVKLYNIEGEVLLAACDKELLNQRFEEGELQIHVVDSFYNGTEVTKEGFIIHLASATIMNLVGEEVIQVAREEGLLQESGILRIDGVPHAQITRAVPM